MLNRAATSCVLCILAASASAQDCGEASCADTVRTGGNAGDLGVFFHSVVPEDFQRRHVAVGGEGVAEDGRFGELAGAVAFLLDARDATDFARREVAGAVGEPTLRGDGPPAVPAAPTASTDGAPAAALRGISRGASRRV